MDPGRVFDTQTSCILHCLHTTGCGVNAVIVVKLQVVRRVDVPVRDVKWSESGNLLAIVSDSSFYLLRYDQATVDSWFDSEREIDEDGIEDAFELITEVSERVRTGLFATSWMPRISFLAFELQVFCTAPGAVWTVASNRILYFRRGPGLVLL
jgi:Coatomer WD associated region